MFAVEEETHPCHFSIHRLAHYCLDLGELFNTDRVVPVVIFLSPGSSVPLDKVGGFFIARALDTLNPIIQSAQREDVTKLTGVTGLCLKDALALDKFPKRKRSDLDVMWKVGK